MKRIIIVILVVAVAVAGFFYWRQYQNERTQQELMSNLQTDAVTTGQLVSSIGATGVVRSNQSAMLTWQTSGTVENVLFNVGDSVQKGEELAVLAETSLPQSVILAKADLVSAEKALDDLMNSELQRAQALEAVEQAEQALEDLMTPELAQARALEAIADAEKAVDIAETRLRNLQSTASQTNIDAAEAEVVLARDALERAEEKYAPYASKPEDNVTRATLKAELAEAQQRYDFAVRNLNALTGTASSTDIATAQANLATAEASLIQAQREYDRIKDGPTEADIALAEAQLEDAQRRYERVKDGPDPDDIAAAETRIAALQATIDQSHITAPFDGVLTMVELLPGDQVNPGTVAFRIDDLSKMLVEIEVSEIDINQIEVGQEVLLTLDAILAKEYSGTITKVGLVGNTVQGVVSFTVTVELSEVDEDVRPGMTSAVNIVIEQIEEALLVPNRAVRVVDGERVVYILENGQIEEVAITLGATSDLYSEEISGNISVGDQVILNPPSNFFDQFGPPHGR